jgi:hypothetical protein
MTDWNPLIVLTNLLVNITRDGAPERGAIEDAHDKPVDIEVKATVKLRSTLPTTIAYSAGLE